MTDKSVSNNYDDQKGTELEFTRLAGAVVDNRWLVIAVTVLFCALSVAYSLLATPIYRADALVQVEQNVGNSLLNDISQILPTSQPASAAEIELIRSRMILGKTVEQLGLDILSEEKYIPLIGAGVARITGNNQNAKLNFEYFDVPESYYESKFILTVLGENKFVIESADGINIPGEVGQAINENGISLKIKHIKAKEGTKFKIQKISEIQAINNLSNRLNVSDKGKDTGVLLLTLLGEDPLNVKESLKSIARNYLEQNIERKSAEAAKSLEFLKEQLPSIRSKLDIAENALNIYRQQSDSVDLSLEAKSALETMVAIDTQLNELTFKEAEISKLYTKDHPAYRSLLEKRDTLLEEKVKLNKKISSMPKTQQEILSLTRDVQANQEVYMQLLSKQQELNITKASTVGNVRIVDEPITQPKPVEPNKILIVLVMTILGAFLSICYVTIKVIFHKGIENATDLEEMGINVYASIPISDWQRKQDQTIGENRKSGKRFITTKTLLADTNPSDLAIEAIRSLRTSLHFAMLEAKNNVLMITGVSPTIGKTFVSLNLAAVIAQSGKNILVIDGDIRRGYIHKVFGDNDASKGLSNYLSGQLAIDDIVSVTSVNDLHYIARGDIAPNPAELLMHDRFQTLLDWASSKYDMVLIDTPPILAVTDAAIIGKNAGTTFLVAGFEINTIKEIELCYKRFNQNGIEINGCIINGMVKKASNYYSYGHQYYSYEKK
ncbi:polysaccharide biosynthesis tyrosine autokinase [Biostraticola tofi]|nr:polysaccharide biosynthesis tyrosine autokinase [Biostraticola tofi]